LSVAVATGSPIGITELEVSYDGTAPPRDQFAAVVAIGWTPAVASPPPRSAIDWSEPDAERGSRYTIRSYRATSRVEATAGPASAAMVEAAMAVAITPGASVPSESLDRSHTAPAGARPGEAVVKAVVLVARVPSLIDALGPSVVVLDRVDTV